MTRPALAIPSIKSVSALFVAQKEKVMTTNLPALRALYYAEPAVNALIDEVERLRERLAGAEKVTTEYLLMLSDSVDEGRTYSVDMVRADKLAGAGRAFMKGDQG